MNQEIAGAASVQEPGACGPAAPCRPAGQPAESMRKFTRFVGLDVHKKTVMACVLDASGRKLHQEEFACRPDQLERFARQHMGPGSVAALEATTNTWAVCNVILPLCGLIKVSNPLKTKAIAQASVKTDKVDAHVLGQLLRCDYLPGVWVPDEPTRTLRQTVARRTALVADRTAGASGPKSRPRTPTPSPPIPGRGPRGAAVKENSKTVKFPRN